MTKISKQFKEAVESGKLEGYQIGDSNVTLLRYTFEDAECLEFPLLKNESRQWRCWITTSDNVVHRAGGVFTGTQKELKPTTADSFDDALRKALNLWSKQNAKDGYSTHREPVVGSK